MDSVRKRKNNNAPKNDIPSVSVSYDFYSQEDLGTIKRNSETKSNRPRKKIWKKIIFSVLILIFFAVLGWVVYFSWKVSAVSQKITIENNSSSLVKNIHSVITPLISSGHKTLEGESDGRVNILLLGAAGENNPGKNLTDTIMVMSINTQTKKVGLLSLPRDLYVNIPDTQAYTKINSVYQYGLNNKSGTEPIRKTVEEILGIKMHYFLVLDFEGFKKIIDDIGGIKVQSERDIYDSRYPGPNYSYEVFELKKGVHQMDGSTALKYARERHADPEGDFGRAKRQQQIIQSVKNKVFSLKTFLNFFALNNLLDTLEKHIVTNIELDDIDSFIWWSKQVDSQNITTAVADAWKKDSLLKVSHIDYNGTRAFILVPRVGNYSEIQELAENLFDLEELKRRRAEIEKENASVVIINQSADAKLTNKIKDLLTDKLGIKKISILNNDDNLVRSQTIIYDYTEKEKVFTLDEIIKKLPAEPFQNKNDILEEETGADFIILLGTDLEDIYKYEEDSMEDLNNAGLDQQYLDLLESR